MTTKATEPRTLKATWSGLSCPRFCATLKAHGLRPLSFREGLLKACPIEGQAFKSGAWKKIRQGEKGRRTRFCRVATLLSGSS